MTVLTIGHSNRSADEIVQWLAANGVTLLADVRTIPRSRHNPQFNSDAFAATLAARSIAYHHLKDLGGLRKPRPDSLNAGWENASFRGYADYMQTPAFEHALAALIERAETDRVALMCAEAVPWRCHRSLIADALLARGLEVVHIMGPRAPRPHRMTSFAQVESTAGGGPRVTYPFALRP